VPLENGIRVDRFGSDFPKMTAAYTPLAFQAQEISEELAEAIASGTYWQFAESPGLPVRDIKRVAKWDGEGRCFYLETGAPFFELSLHSEGQYVIEDYVKGICRLHGVKVANEDGGFSFEAAEIKDVKFVQLKYVVTTLGGRLYYPIHAIVRA
jgi:hypothetical protein